MDSYRANLDQPQNSTSYLVLTSIFLILSAIGLFLLFVFLPNRSKTSPPQLITETITGIPTSIPTEVLLPTEAPTTPLSTPSSTIKPTVMLKPTTPASSSASPTIASASAGAFVNYQNAPDNFSVTYSSSRQFYKDTEFSGNRYTFYNLKGNIAIHVGSVWSWTHPDRAFTNNLLVDGHNTFRYDIDSQTLIDIQDKTKNYTIQCVHNGNTSLKTECTQFLQSFKFLEP